MALKFYSFQGVDNTVDNIKRIIMSHKNDLYLKVFDNQSVKAIFDYISKIIPYISDPRKEDCYKGNCNDNIELLKSPYFTLGMGGKADEGGDCDDKSILAACIFERKGIPYRMAVVSQKPDQSLHHIYLEIFYKGSWVPFDPTYSHNKIFKESQFTKKKIYDWMKGSTISYVLTPGNLKNRSCKCSGSCKTCSRQKTLSGNSSLMQLQGTKLAILEGAINQPANRMPVIKPAQKSNRGEILLCDVMDESEKNELLGYYAEELGISAIVFAVVKFLPVIASFFGSLFSKEAYQDAFNAYDQANAQITAAFQNDISKNQAAFETVVVNRAIKAVMRVDVMNPPGADLCTSSDRCGNRAEWSKVQPQVMQAVKDFTPMLIYIHSELLSGKYHDGLRNGWGTDEELMDAYRQWKSKSGGLYSSFQSAVQNPQSKVSSQAGINNPVIIIGLIGAALYLIMSKKKHHA